MFPEFGQVASDGKCVRALEVVQCSARLNDDAAGHGEVVTRTGSGVTREIERGSVRDDEVAGDGQSPVAVTVSEMVVLPAITLCVSAEKCGGRLRSSHRRCRPP